MTSHADLLAAIDKARETLTLKEGVLSGLDLAINRRRMADAAHLDTLRAILDLHQQRHSSGGTDVPPFDYCYDCDGVWPCSTVEVVAGALTRMGALPTVVYVTNDMQIDDPLDDDYEPAIDVDGYPT